MELEAPGVRIEHGHSDDIGRQQIRGELHALELEAERRGERVRQGGLAEPRQVLDQQVPARQQRDECEPHLLALAEHERIDLRLCPVKGVAQAIG